MPIPRVIFDRVRDEIERELADWLPRIVAEMQPVKVLLFGSAARGEAGEDSNIDLCVIADSDLGFFDRIGRVIGLYRGSRAVEVLVYTPSWGPRALRLVGLRLAEPLWGSCEAPLA